ncbi:Luminescence regulatory protein LuxO [compost metagenome]
MPVDFALVCATHRPLAHEGPEAPVRPDLYFRIAEYTVTLEPLRTRADRLELLRALWAAQGPGPVLPPQIEARLAAYPWPGNYRQLAAVLRTLHVLAGPSGVVDADMLPAELSLPGARGNAADTPEGGGSADLQSMADAAIRDALAAHGGNVSRAARALGVHRSTVYRRAGGLGLARSPSR